MKDVLEEGVIITLIALQPKKEKVATNYSSSFPTVAGCYNGSCLGGCKTSGCKGSVKQKKK